MMYIPMFQMTQMQYVLNRRIYMTDEEKKRVIDFIDGLFKDDPSISLSQQTKNIEEFMTLVSEKVGLIESEYSKNVYNINGKMRDIEHLIEFSSLAEKEGIPIETLVDHSNIPPELQGLSSEEYLKKLQDTLQYRRRKKDMHAILKTTRENLSVIRRFVTNMDNRIYSLRAGDDNLDGTDEQKIVQSDESAYVERSRPRFQQPGKRTTIDTTTENFQPKVALPHSSNTMRYVKGNSSINIDSKQRKDVR